MSKEDIEKLDKQIELLKKDKNGNKTGEIEKVVTEIHDPNDENHVINISYINSEVNETTKELKDLNKFNNDVDEVVDSEREDTKKIIVTQKLDAIVEQNQDENSANVNTVNNVNNKSNKTLFTILGIVIGVLVLIFIILLFVFSGDDKTDNKNVVNNEDETSNFLSKTEMIKIIDDYGKLLEKEISDYYNLNSNLPDFSTVNNLIDLDYDVVCYTHEIYDDKSVYLDECMVDYKDVKYSYGIKQEVKKEVIDNNNIKVYVHKTTKVPTLDEPADKTNYYFYSSNVDSNIDNIKLLNKTVYLTYYDLDNNNIELYNYVTGKRAFYKVDYKNVSLVSLYSNDNSLNSSEYVVLNLNNSKARVYSLITGEAISEEFDYIRSDALANERLAVSNNGNWGMLNLKSGSFVIPIKYTGIYKSGSSIIAYTSDKITIFDEDGNEYLDDFNITNTSSVYDKYVFYKNKMYNLNGKELCEFDTKNELAVQNNRLVGDKLIYYVFEDQNKGCYIFNISLKECIKSTVDECNKIY